MRRPAKTCPVCESGARVLDYKDERTLGRFLTAEAALRGRPAQASTSDSSRRPSNGLVSWP